MARVQVTIDAELERALDELGRGRPRSKVIRDLAVRGAEEVRADLDQRREAVETLRGIATGEDDGFDFGVAEELRRVRR